MRVCFLTERAINLFPFFSDRINQSRNLKIVNENQINYEIVRSFRESNQDFFYYFPIFWDNIKGLAINKAPNQSF